MIDKNTTPDHWRSRLWWSSGMSVKPYTKSCERRSFGLHFLPTWVRDNCYSFNHYIINSNIQYYLRTQMIIFLVKTVNPLLRVQLQKLVLANQRHLCTSWVQTMIKSNLYQKCLKLSLLRCFIWREMTFFQNLRDPTPALVLIDLLLFMEQHVYMVFPL